MIFESLNSTGVDLSPSDLIRNFILMRLPEADQTRLYNTYWSRIETLFRGSERVFDNFIRDYLALRSRPTKLERSDRVYTAFRHEFAEIGIDPEALEGVLADLLHHARYYAAFAVRSEDNELGRAFTHLRRLGDVPAILVMRLYQAHEAAGSLSLLEFCEAIRLLESYLLRRAAIGAQTRSYGFEFAKLAYKINDDRPLESLKVALARVSPSSAFPSDAEFEEALITSDIYHKRFCFHLLEGLENRGSKERSDTSGYSIEHVLPQNENLGEGWRQMLGADWQAVQETWLHRLGNLTLTGYNSSYSDRAFDEKKSIKGGFNQSSVRLNQDIRDSDRWTETEISARGQRLARRALDIWPALKADPEAIKRQEFADKVTRSKRRDIEQVAMSEQARDLFEILRSKLKKDFPGLIEMAESKSVSYHDPEFFLEIIPRKRGLGLLVALDFNEVQNEDGFAQDTSDYSFVANATYDGGVLIVLRDKDRVDRAMRLIRRAHETQSGV